MKYSKNQSNNNSLNIIAEIGYFFPGLHFLVFIVVTYAHLFTQYGTFKKHFFMEYNVSIFTIHLHSTDQFVAMKRNN